MFSWNCCINACVGKNNRCQVLPKEWNYSATDNIYTYTSFLLSVIVTYISNNDLCQIRDCPVVYYSILTLHWRHNDHDGVSNHQHHACLLNRLFRRRSKKTSSSASLTFVWGIGEFPAQRASYAENVSIWWRHHVMSKEMDRITEVESCHRSETSVNYWDFTDGRKLLFVYSKCVQKHYEYEPVNFRLVQRKCTSWKYVAGLN